MIWEFRGSSAWTVRYATGGTRLFRHLPDDCAVFTEIRSQLPHGYIGISDVRCVRISRTDLCACVSDETRFGGGNASSLRCVLCFACVCVVLDLFCRFGDHADQSLCEGADAVRKMVLDLFIAGRYADRHDSRCIWQPAGCQRPFLRMDCVRKPLDVLRFTGGSAPGQSGNGSRIDVILVPGVNTGRVEDECHCTAPD